MKGRDIIFTGLQSWDISIGSNAKNIAIEMSHQNRVLYINPPPDLSTMLRTRAVRTRGELRKVGENLFVADLPVALMSINMIPSAWLFDRLNRINNRRFATQIAATARDLDFDKIVHINDNDIFRSFYLKEMLQPTLSVYYRRDWLLDVAYWRRHGRRLEPQLATRSDLVLANSPYLVDTIKEFNPRSYYVGQGVDLTLYDPLIGHPTPPELAGVPHPIVGYTGAVNSLRLDADLLAEVAREMPSVSFVLVGGEDQFFKSHQLHTLPNVTFTGNRPPAELANYIAHFDLCINPQVLNPTTRGNYPRKIDEYLAMGKPTVATYTPTMEIFRDHVTLCHNATEYISAIYHALETDNEQLRKDRTRVARGHSWEASVEAMYNHIDPLLP